MIFFKLDYVIEMEQAARRDAAQCAAHAKRSGTPAEPNALRSKLVSALKSLANEYLTHQSWLAHNGLFAPTPMASARAGEVVLTERHRNYARELRKLAGVKLSAREADMVWPRLLEHKWYMGERMGRDVGLRVAAADFFENIQPPREHASWRTAWEPLPRLPMMLPFGERA
ncbi:MAG TPA: DUF4032 domain-containing protein [Pyrinomonadaceae bacterium]